MDFYESLNKTSKDLHDTIKKNSNQHEKKRKEITQQIRQHRQDLKAADEEKKDKQEQKNKEITDEIHRLRKERLTQNRFSQYLSTLKKFE